jgi:hypothetical protein
MSSAPTGSSSGARGCSGCFTCSGVHMALCGCWTRARARGPAGALQATCPAGITMAAVVQGDLLLYQGQYDQADAVYQESVQVCNAVQILAPTLLSLGLLAQRQVTAPWPGNGWTVRWPSCRARGSHSSPSSWPRWDAWPPRRGTSTKPSAAYARAWAWSGRWVIAREPRRRWKDWRPWPPRRAGRSAPCGMGAAAAGLCVHGRSPVPL